MRSNDFVARLRDTLLNETLFWLGVVSLPMVTLSLLRISNQGWRPTFGLQVLLLVLVWLFWFQRRRIAYSMRLGLVLFAMGVAGLSGYLMFGPAAAAGPLLVLMLVIAAVFTESRVAIGVGLLMLAGLVVIAWCSVRGTLQFPIDYHAYARTPLAWLLILVAWAGYGGIVARLVWRLLRTLYAHQQQLTQANSKLEIRTEALVQAERFSKSTLDALTARIAILDESGAIVAVNRAWCLFAETGEIESANVCEGVNYLDVCDAAAGTSCADAAAMAAGIRLVLQGVRDEFALEYTCDSPMKARNFIVRVTRFPGPGLIRVAVAHEDITSYRQAESVVRQLSRAVEQSPAGVVITNRAGDIEYVNSQFEKQTGYSMVEVLGRNPSMLKSGRTSMETYREMWGALTDGREWRGELCNRRKDGHLLWEDVAISALTNEQGRVTHYVSVQQDITERKEAIEAAHLARQREIEVASGIQHFLVGEIPADIEGAWLAAYADPSQVLNGDFYTVRRYRPGCFEVLVADVMGKGVQAALMGAGIGAVYSNIVADLVHAGTGNLPTTVELVNAMHRALTPQLMALSAFATLALYRFDLEAGTLTWVNAGHTPGLLTTGFDSSPVAILGDNLPIGILADEVYVERSIAVGPGCNLLMFSDGITEARNPQGEEFGLARLSDLIEAGSRATLPPSTLVQALRGELRRFTGGGPGADDLTAVMVTLRPRRGGSDRRVEDRVAPCVFTLPWRLEGLRGFRDRIKTCASTLPEHDADALVLASFEAATNIIRHAPVMVGDATLACRIVRQSDAVVVELIYPSAAFTPPAQLQPDFSGTSEGGFGLYIIEQSVDSVEYSSPMPGVACIRLVKRPEV